MDNMDVQIVIWELERNLDVFVGLLKNTAGEAYTWKPSPEKWCLLEIICHLYDEEREDFRSRTKHVLETPSAPLPSIDPQGWVQQRNYLQQDYEVMLSKFIIEREQSVKWLQALVNPDWNNAINHPSFGQMSAKMFLSNWLAHDYLHFRQILKIKFDYLKHITGEELNYAGTW